MDASVRDITAVLNMHEKRLGTVAEATKAFTELCSVARATGKKGTITIKLEVEPDKNDEDALMVSAAVTSTLPKPDKKKALMYHDEKAGTFSRTDPAQLELLAEKEAERQAREQAVTEANLPRVGRGAETVRETA